MIQEKAKELYEELKQGKGSASLFGIMTMRLEK